LSTTKRALAWWASTTSRARLTAAGASAIVIVLLAVSVFVWISPANPVSQAIADVGAVTGQTAAQRALVKERNHLQAELDAAQKQLSSSKTDLTATKTKVASLQQQLWSAEGKIDSAGSSTPSNATTSTKTTTVKKPATAAVTAAPITAPTKAQIMSPASPYFGMFTQQAPFNWATFDATAAAIGSKPNTVGYFGGWDEAFRASAVTSAWQRDTLPILTWESRPIDATNDQVNAPDYTLPEIIGDPAKGIAGKYDAYLHQYAKDIVATGLPLGIRLDHEMNGIWYPWSEVDGSGNSINGNNVGDYVKMWQHVHDIFQEEGANSLVIWIWAPNIINNLPTSHKTSAYLAGLYPGDDYVDWVGLSGYLRPPYASDQKYTFDYTFTPSLNQLRSLTHKPIFLAEIGASETDGHKVAWVTSLFQGLAKPENSDIVGFDWFDLAVTSYVEGVRETNDWRIDSRADSLAAFVAGINAPDSKFRLTKY
jgi:hypothetical protein